MIEILRAEPLYWWLPIGLVMLVVISYTYVDYRRHRQPLISENPRLKYTFWHHLKVVTLPVLKYRFLVATHQKGY